MPVDAVDVEVEVGTMKFKKANDSDDEDVSSDGEVAGGSKNDDRYVLLLYKLTYSKSVRTYEVCSKLSKEQEALESFASPDYFRGNRILLNNSIIRMAAKSPFCLPSILLPEAMDQSETPLILKLRPSSVYQGAIHQF